MKVHAFILFLGLVIQGWVELNAQPNLVPNPSFEMYDTCPPSQSRICNAVPWFQPHRNSNGVCLGSSSTDYYNFCASWLVGVPINFQGHQYPRTDSAYAGFYAGGDSINYPQVREYLEVKLNDSLSMGKKYCVIFYVSHADTSNVAISSLGAYFSSDTLISANYDFIPVTPQVVYTSGFITEENNWVEISGIYTAAGGEKFMTIGNFADDTNTPYIQIHSYPGNTVSYYYIDDVSVIEMADSSSACGNVGIANINNPFRLSVYPNPATNELRIDNSELKIKEIEIYSSLGEKVLSQQEASNQQHVTISVADFPPGIYFITVTDQAGNKVTKKVVKM